MKTRGSLKFWLIYYSVFAVAIAGACLAWPKRMGLSYASILPALFVLCAIFFAWYYPSNLRITILELDRIERRIRYAKGDGLYLEPQQEREYWREDDYFISRIFLFELPVGVFFLFFGGAGLTTFMVFVLFFIPYFATIGFCTHRIKRDAQRNYEQRMRELEEQKKREELGHWK